MLTAAKGMCVLAGVIRFFCPSDIQSSCKAPKTATYFLDLAAEQRIKSPLLQSFDCACSSSLCRGWVSNGQPRAG